MPSRRSGIPSKRRCPRRAPSDCMRCRRGQNSQVLPRPRLLCPPRPSGSPDNPLVDGCGRGCSQKSSLSAGERVADLGNRLPARKNRRAFGQKAIFVRLLRFNRVTSSKTAAVHLGPAATPPRASKRRCCHRQHLCAEPKRGGAGGSTTPSKDERAVPAAAPLERRQRPCCRRAHRLGHYFVAFGRATTAGWAKNRVAAGAPTEPAAATGVVAPVPSPFSSKEKVVPLAAPLPRRPPRLRRTPPVRTAGKSAKIPRASRFRLHRQPFATGKSAPARHEAVLAAARSEAAAKNSVGAAASTFCSNFINVGARHPTSAFYLTKSCPAPHEARRNSPSTLTRIGRRAPAPSRPAAAKPHCRALKAHR